MKIIVAQPIEEIKIKGTNPFRLYTSEKGYYDFLPAGQYAIPAQLGDIDYEDMVIGTYFVTDINGNMLKPENPMLPPIPTPADERWCCSRKNAWLANWIEH